MNIYQKLIEVRKAIPFLKKDKEGYQFKFVSSSQTLGALREAMDANNLLLIPRVMSERVLGHETKKGDHQYFTVLGMEFTWVNAEVPEETIVCSWTGQGLDDGEKGVGKALTYAEKYFMLLQVMSSGLEPEVPGFAVKSVALVYALPPRA